MRDVENLESMARRIRGTVIEMSHRGGMPHLGGALSCVDILVALFFRALRVDPEKTEDPHRDRFILSKGHAASALYAVMAHRGFTTIESLEHFGRPGGHLPEHPSPGCIPGLEVATGSLGHGLPIGLGMALAAKIRQQVYKTVVLLSDGECNEGSVWEAAQAAPAFRLDNLIAIIDYNKWQATGRSQEVLALEPLLAKWKAFGWDAHEVDGHDMTDLLKALDEAWQGSARPQAIIAHTVKGKGASFMEDDNNWHYRIPSQDEVARAKEELGLS